MQRKLVILRRQTNRVLFLHTCFLCYLHIHYDLLISHCLFFDVTLDLLTIFLELAMNFMECTAIFFAFCQKSSFQLCRYVVFSVVFFSKLCICVVFNIIDVQSYSQFKASLESL